MSFTSYLIPRFSTAHFIPAVFKYTFILYFLNSFYHSKCYCTKMANLFSMTVAKSYKKSIDIRFGLFLVLSGKNIFCTYN